MRYIDYSLLNRVSGQDNGSVTGISLRKEMSQADFGKRLGVGQTMVQQWVSKKRRISIEKPLDIEHHFGIDAVLLNPDVEEIIKMVQSRGKLHLKTRRIKRKKPSKPTNFVCVLLPSTGQANSFATRLRRNWC